MRINSQIIILLFFITGTAALHAQNYNFPSLTASPKALEYHELLIVNNGSWRTLAEAALWASSVNAGQGAEEKAAGYLSLLDAAAAELGAAEDLPLDMKERGEYVLGFIHKKLLKSYSVTQTRLDDLLSSGRYNCVSSAMLYTVLGLSVGLNIEGIITKDHAFAAVHTGTERIDVETTTRYGFDPGNRKEFHNAFGNTGFVYVPATHYNERAVVTPAELVSLILRNRIFTLEKQNRFSESVPLSINREALLLGNRSGLSSMAHNSEDKTKTELFGNPHKEVMSRISNLGTDLIKKGKEDEAIAWAEYVGESFPYPSWQELVRVAANNKLARLIRTKKTSEARSVLAALRSKLSDENYLELDAMLIDVEAAEKTNAIQNPGDAEKAIAFLHEAWERLPPSRRTEMRTVAILNEASRLGKARDFTAGMKWLSNAIEQYGSNTALEKAFQTMRSNRVGQLHNDFINLFNKKDYAGAKASIQKSLEEFPAERQLLQDLAMVEKVLQ